METVWEMDAIIVTSVAMPAPSAACPTGRWTPEGAFEQFLGNRAQIAEIANSRTDLRERVMEHPVLGVLDGHHGFWRWVRTARGTGSRLWSLKSDERYPQN